MPKIDIDRIEQDITALSRFGFNEEDGGVYRQGFSEADMAARHWLRDTFAALGMAHEIDGAGNVVGRYGPSTGPAVVTASHLDSVPAGGIFDGTLGVIAGLECVRTMIDHDIVPNYGIEIIGTSEEEGRFGGMLGAQALTGNLTLDWIEKAADEHGFMLTDAMAAAGLDYRAAMHAYRRPETLRAFVELHVEQGPVLDTEGLSIGVVEGISGVFKWIVRLKGKADHAGTAPMDMRADAFMGLVDFAHEIPRIIAEEGTDKSRITVGHVALKPGFPHTVPGEVEFTIVGRDLDGGVMARLAEACGRVLASIARKHKLKFDHEQMSWLEPSPCDAAMIETISGHAERLGLSWKTMPSGAGHDAQFFSPLTPTGMIFVPSVGGVSHAPDEWTHWSDIEQGAQLLYECIAELAEAETRVAEKAP